MLALRATLLHYDSYVRTVEAIQTAESKVSMLTRAEWRRTPSNIWRNWFSVLNKASKCTVYLPSRKSSGVAGNWLLAFCVSSLIYTCLRKVTPHKCHAALTWRKRLDRKNNGYSGESLRSGRARKAKIWLWSTTVAATGVPTRAYIL